ncbi:MAG: regulatory iron-sulfur-containing complex subunit RicT [Rikenellaceae bacterium]
MSEKDYKLDIGRGCKFKVDAGGTYSAEASEGCYKLHTTDWLEDYPNQIPTEIFEVRFKNTRKSYYSNVNNLELKKGDIVAVEASPGHDIGVVSMTGDMVARQMRRVGFNPQNGEFKKIYRKAKSYDIEKWQDAIALEHDTMIRSRQIAADMKLNMKIGDVEYQGDKIKAIFYYIADERVDFRELIKVFAEQFSIRIEMKQIGARQEAGRIGGLGSCGRQLCCASWISNFVSVTTNSARIQEVSLNPQKLAGQCSKLKCCFTYELDSYIDARKEFPKVNQPLQALDGEYFLVKQDILAKTMSFSTAPNAMVAVVTIPIKRVREILEINKKGKKVDAIVDAASEKKVVADIGFVDVLGEENINRFDKKRDNNRSRNKNKNRNRNNNHNNQGGENKAKETQAQQPKNQHNNHDAEAQGDAPKKNFNRNKKRRKPNPNNPNNPPKDKA